MKVYLQLTGAIFTIVTAAHALRLLLQWQIVIDGWTVPMWLSWVGVFVAGMLALWAFSLAPKVRR